MPPRNPATPLPDPAHEAYVQARAQGMQAAQAARAHGVAGYRNLERQRAFRERLRDLSGEASSEPGVTLQWLVSELKRTVSGARVAGQYKNANEALAQLAELYGKYPHLRGGDAPPASGDVAKPEEAAKPRGSRLQRRMAHRAALSVVTEAVGE